MSLPLPMYVLFTALLCLCNVHLAHSYFYLWPFTNGRITDDAVEQKVKEGETVDIYCDYTFSYIGDDRGRRDQLSILKDSKILTENGDLLSGFYSSRSDRQFQYTNKFGERTSWYTFEAVREDSGMYECTFSYISNDTMYRSNYMLNITVT